MRLFGSKWKLKLHIIVEIWLMFPRADIKFLKSKSERRKPSTMALMLWRVLDFELELRCLLPWSCGQNVIFSGKIKVNSFK